jgi:hypothetical protein
LGDVPLPGVTIGLTGAGFETSSFTDEHGAYRLNAIPKGVVTITTQLSGFVSERHTICLSQDDATFEIQLQVNSSCDVIGTKPDPITAWLPGRVVDSRGTPIRGAMIEAVIDGHQVARTKTDKAGKFTLRLRFDDLHVAHLRFSSRGYETTEIPIPCDGSTLVALFPSCDATSK